jgi:hypothetical protein
MDDRVFNPDGTITTIIPAKEWTDPITGMKETIPEKRITIKPAKPEGWVTTVIPAREWTDPITGVKETIPEKIITIYTTKNIFEDILPGQLRT